MAWLIFYLGLFLLSFCSTGLVRAYALKTALLDIPNQRSSHQSVTPRGGGLGFVLVYFLALLALGFKGFFSLALFQAYLSAGLIIAALGLIDDRRPLKARLRFIVQMIAVILAFAFLDPLPSEFLFKSYSLPLSLLYGLGLVYWLWMINLYNFMDGINGLAAMEGIFICLAASCLYFLTGQLQALFLPLVLAAVLGGFLVWNFPRPFIFMGDVGSGFLGSILALLSIQAGFLDSSLFWAWLILLGVFMVDATFTLIRRFIQKENIFEAHRCHAYQKAAIRYNKHTPVTLGILAINTFWLFPCALLVALDYISGYQGLILAYSPLVFLVFKYQAGKKIALSFEENQSKAG